MTGDDTKIEKGGFGRPFSFVSQMLIAGRRGTV
jgi:hypothetical protein